MKREARGAREAQTPARFISAPSASSALKLRPHSKLKATPALAWLNPAGRQKKSAVIPIVNNETKRGLSPGAKILLVPLVLVVLPVAIPIALLALICWCAASATISLFVSLWWIPRGIRFLVVYSESAQWMSYFEDNVVPKFGRAARVINLSREGGKKGTLDWRIYRHCAGYRNHFPIVIRFSPFGPSKAIRFYEAYMLSKKGKIAALDKAKADLSLWLSDSSR